MPATPVKPSKTDGRGRGRPFLGKAVLVRLDEQETQIAKALGAGIVSAGVRVALHAASAHGIESSVAAAKDVAAQRVGVGAVGTVLRDGEKE